ncbi:hypothetical protein ALC56_01640 [Trachymyrmex septentrionalis]|uniref:DDE Tnp4 domain-containing protein n=1 Tax=Trachymyrmex septentrionalis TaxID=34720 RepID=A0A195FTG1_9HYME|nr:hypothetical protein ALC56_01640 [Trachymyrmex septentrionalis]
MCFFSVAASIDDSHIDKSSENSVVYINRKHYFSIHMQGTVNEKKKFLDVFVGYPGSVHNARVLLVWLKTCQHFVKSQCRISVEHGFGELKQCFRQIYFLKLRNMEFIVKFILVCCILHNLTYC